MPGMKTTNANEQTQPIPSESARLQAGLQAVLKHESHLNTWPYTFTVVGR